MLNWIWLAFILVSVVVGGFTGKLPEMTKGAFETAETAVMGLALPLIGIWAIWLGMMRLAEGSGLVQLLARSLRPLMRVLFPEVPSEHPAIGAMVLNMAANMLGLGNAATPLGLRAMTQLERLNPHPGVATNAMCTFLALNTASIQLLPTTAISILFVAGAKDPFAIIPTAFLATVIAATSGVLSAKFLERLPLFRARPLDLPEASTTLPAGAAHVAEEPAPVVLPPLSVRRRIILAVFFVVMAAIAVTLFASQSVEAAGGASRPAWLAQTIRAVQALSILAVPFLFSFFPLYAALRGLKVYEQFVEGAKEAFGTAQRVIPYLVAMLISITLLRKAGIIDMLTNALRSSFEKIHFPPDLLPMVLMRPLSGSGTQGLFAELAKHPPAHYDPAVLGPWADTFVCRLAGTIYGSTETTFYVLAVYFGAVAIRQTRHAIAVGLIADTVAVIASVTLCWIMFGKS